ncbi:MAG: hypothetical protein ACXVGA_08505, partial [Mycobacteriaceae bacterium]
MTPESEGDHRVADQRAARSELRRLVAGCAKPAPSALGGSRLRKLHEGRWPPTSTPGPGCAALSTAVLSVPCPS